MKRGKCRNGVTGTAYVCRERFFAPLVKTRGFGMTQLIVSSTEKAYFTASAVLLAPFLMVFPVFFAPLAVASPALSAALPVSFAAVLTPFFVSLVAVFAPFSVF